MALTNSQKSRIIRVANENGYTGDYEELFEQAKTEGIFGEVPEPDVSYKKDDYKLDIDSVLIDDGPRALSDPANSSNFRGSSHITSGHETHPVSSALMDFVNNPAYKVQPQQQGEKGGFKKNYTHGGLFHSDPIPAEASSTSVYMTPNNLEIEEEYPEDEYESLPTYASWDEGAKANPTSEIWDGKPNPYKSEMTSSINLQNVVTAASLPYAIPLALRAGAYNLIPRVAGTSTLDALGYYGGYHGITHGPDDLNAFIADPSWGTAFDLGMDALGVAGGVYSTSRLATGINNAKNAKLIKAAELEDVKTATAETANNLAIKNKKYAPTTKEKGFIENIKQKNIAYVKSEEYITKRMANTGESRQSILKQIDEYIEEANKVTPQFQPKHLMGDARGNYKYSTSLSEPNSKINILNPKGTNKGQTLFEKEFLAESGITSGEKISISQQQYNTIDHEWKHLFSPTGKVDKSSDIYKNAMKYESASYKKAVAEVDESFLNATTAQEADAAIAAMAGKYKNINSQFNIDETMIMTSIPKHSTKAYKNYPTLKLKGDDAKFIKYLQDPAEQQVRLVRAGDYFKKTFGWDGTKAGMTDDMLETFTNHISKGTGSIPDDVRGLVEASTNTASEFRTVLSKAWALAVPVGLGALSQTDTKQKGGFKYENGGEKKTEGGVPDDRFESANQIDDSTLTIANSSHSSDPWEYAKQSDGTLLTRRKAIGEDAPANEWLKPKKGSSAYTSIQDTIVFKSNPIGPIENLTENESEDVRAIYKADPENSENKLTAAHHNKLNREGANTSSIQQMLVNNKYDLGVSGYNGDGVDGDWGTKTSKAFKHWSENNLNLPEYEGLTEKICQEGAGCSEQATNMLLDLFPTVTKNDLGPEDAWYRQKHVVELGGDLIWGTSDKQNKGSWSDLPDMPPIEVWKDFRVGDLVHVNRKGKDNYEKESDAGYGLDMNRGSEHQAFFIGMDPNTGIPLVMHGAGKGDMKVDPINNITLPGGKEYKIDGVSRPVGMKDRPVINKDHFIFNSQKTDQLQSNLTESHNPLNSQEYFATRYVEHINDNLGLIANTTGASPEAVSEASHIAYGIFKNETGDFKQIMIGKGKEIAKNNLDADLIANLRTGANMAGEIWNTGEVETEFALPNSLWDFIIPGSMFRDVKNKVAPKTDETSVGAGRIKFDMQTKDEDGNPTEIGQWYKAMDIGASDLAWTSISAVNDSFTAISLQVIDYTKRIKRHKEYDPNTNTIAGVPIQYAIATMHKSPNLASRVDANHSVLDYLKLGDRDYSNAVLENAEDISVAYHGDGEGTGEYEKAQEFKDSKERERENKKKEELEEARIELEKTVPTLFDWIDQVTNQGSIQDNTKHKGIPYR